MSRQNHNRDVALMLTLAFGVALVLSLVWTDDDAYNSASRAAAIAEQSEALHLVKAATEICGPQKSWVLTDTPGQIVCLPRSEGQTLMAGGDQ